FGPGPSATVPGGAGGPTGLGLQDGERGERPALRSATNVGNVDAMGLDKRRKGTGQVYGPTRQRLIARFLVFPAVGIVAIVVFKLLVDALDKPLATNPTSTPWAQPNAPQKKPPSPLGVRVP